MNFLLIDNYDSFTFMLCDYLQQTGATVSVIRNDEPELLLLNPTKYDAAVISPGPGTPMDSGYLMQVLPLILNAIPTLGVCLGHQAIGLHFGAKLIHAIEPRHGKTDVMSHNGNEMFEGIPQQFEATRYHSLVLTEMPRSLEVTAECRGEVMAFRHQTKQIFGVQFHPESCQTTHGLRIIENFCNGVKSFEGIKK